MRVTAAFSRLLNLSGIWVRKVVFMPDRVVIHVALRRQRLICPKCSYSTMARESEQDHDSVWRHLDLGVWRLEIHARLRRLRCPEHGALVEGVPFARYGARFTRDFENLVAWLATKTPTIIHGEPEFGAKTGSVGGEVVCASIASLQRARSACRPRQRRPIRGASRVAHDAGAVVQRSGFAYETSRRRLFELLAGE